MSFEPMKKQDKKKTKTVYLEDKGETIYSMAALSGMTPEEQDIIINIVRSCFE